jgi:hypothetical protein
MIRMTLISAAVSVIVFSAPVFAQDANNVSQPTTSTLNDNSSGAAANSGVGMDMNGRSDAGVSPGLTRAEVKQDLIQSEHDGELSRLDSTVYRGE